MSNDTYVKKRVFYYVMKNSLNLLCKWLLDNNVIGPLEIIKGK